MDYEYEEPFNDEEPPYVELELESLNEETLGSLFIIFHLLTIRLAKKMKVNPFDQPAVELIKRNLKS